MVTVYYNAFSFPGAPQSPRDIVRIRAQAYGPGSHRAGQELGLEPEALTILVSKYCIQVHCYALLLSLKTSHAEIKHHQVQTSHLEHLFSQPRSCPA